MRPLLLSVAVPALKQRALELQHLVGMQGRVLAAAAIIVARPVHDKVMTHIGVLLDDGLRVIR